MNLANFCVFLFQGRCNREKPPCKYFHPPQHLKDQLLINGRNHLALKNAIMQQMGLTPGQPLVPGQVPAVVSTQNFGNISTTQNHNNTNTNGFDTLLQCMNNYFVSEVVTP